jgi:putative effector of murein hydrolase
MIIAVAAAFLALALYQIPRLVKKKYWSDLVVFCVLLAAGCLLSLMLAAGIPIPSPSKGVKALLEALELHY